MKYQLVSQTKKKKEAADKNLYKIETEEVDIAPHFKGYNERFDEWLPSKTSNLHLTDLNVSKLIYF